MGMTVNFTLIFFTLYIMQVYGNHFNTDNANYRRFQQILRSFVNKNDLERHSKVLDAHDDSINNRGHKILIDGKESPYEAYQCLFNCQLDPYPVTCVQRCPY